ncbi:hypothetical protein LEN26_011403 [Aphanomyces euteiches]|nr:hypothetical protein AeMF1_020691 [Aphanomyces euteiches]KAH9119823.1 hypothetical protein LEN26_011403 [Aphanomyces euteiches]KAH9195459.1 hypothetical protein AeNC1_002554 [Aphanomyces euteiches]
MFDAWIHGIFRQTQSCPDTHDAMDYTTTTNNKPTMSVHPRPRANSTDDDHTSSNPPHPRSNRPCPWDTKRALCRNCKHIYLKSLSPCAAHCSLDCQSNSAYLLAVTDSIRAVQDACKQPALPQPKNEPSSKACSATTPGYPQDDHEDDPDTLLRHTYVDLTTEKLELARPVEWNFSALY